MLIESKGKYIWDKELDAIMEMDLGGKLKIIRQMLNEIYPGEFTRQAVTNLLKAEERFISYQGLKNLEERKNINSRSATLRELALHYNVPIELFIPSKQERPLNGFFLGKQEDVIPFFDAHYKNCGTIHPGDPRDSELLIETYPEMLDYEGDIDDTDDCIYEEDGAIKLDRVRVEFVMRIYQGKGNNVLMEKKIFGDSSVDYSDIQFLEGVIEYIAEKSRNQKEISSELQDLRFRSLLSEASKKIHRQTE